MTFEINGIQYEPVHHEKNESKGFSKILMTAIALGGMPGLASFGGSDYNRSLPKGIDIIKEFELIQQKKSKLTKWERDRVVSIFNHNYKPVNTSNPCEGK